MTPLNNHSSNDGSLSLIPEQPPLEGTSTAVSAGRDVSVYHQKQSLFFCLPDEQKSMIVRYLAFREVTRLAKTCKYLYDLVNEEKALEKAWYRRFPSAYQNPLDTLVRTKDEQQLRDWLKAFADKDTIGSLLTQKESTFFPAQLFFTNSKLMSQCETFSPVVKIEIPNVETKNKASFSPDSSHLVTVDLDQTAKITGQKTDGSWVVKTTTIPHESLILSPTFSPDGHLMVTDSHDCHAKICAQEDDGSWKVKDTIAREFELTMSTPLSFSVTSATFSTDGRCLLTSCMDGTVKIYDQETDGSWKTKYTIRQNPTVLGASFSADSSHLLVCGENNVTIYGQKDDSSWEVKVTINHDNSVRSASFSADGSYVATASEEGTAKIYGLQSDGSWEKITITTYNVRLYSATFSPDSRHLLTIYEDNTVEIHGPQTDGPWQVKYTFKHNDRIRSASFSPDSNHMVTTSMDNTAKIHCLQADGSWKVKATICHKDYVLSAAFSPDSCHLVTASLDCTAKIYGPGPKGPWEKKAIISDSCGILWAIFSPDGRNVLTMSKKDCTAKIIELQKND
ncbi:F-box/WD repeat-containing protein [Endozoicomonas sp. ALD040]|uniref:F-box/WD repeat-containing protein n=1 Tax=Endozoicomonas sp. ALD040 TaxID=3403079 RepID=UPI003BB194A1